MSITEISSCRSDVSNPTFLLQSFGLYVWMMRVIALYVINGSRPHLLETERSDGFFFLCICGQVCYVLDRCRGGEKHKQVRYSLVVVIIMEIQYYFCFCFFYYVALLMCWVFYSGAGSNAQEEHLSVPHVSTHVVRMFFAAAGWSNYTAVWKSSSSCESLSTYLA